ncbi:MAG: hypothetical protein ACK6CP_05070 [Pseudanabaena sp.]|jgi:hypothetical protein|nr:hypothetical protein [Pseudanabaena sp. M090S1SP2A07QC]MCA6505844.1 hypothetical protein [Pseudanabaena sp. M172S2SP2A07QC]MCA6521240.1 hypothetical protein [Pseudanabaena sp. M051S1SP2A07QC]MCA6525015.1 hypothetical protein [Pseudanabaena sp. M179S2SP2A07QC]MCA6529509.1 hypothetical protein [Pseudanabaena sp. M125S2SP2A07QC]MCA6534013.1 hypothetical protein [Pseudanabaena sp. M176S2SP2A07QC]MCA6537856.1 hypothetical protein [Pseudanabaena sp. M037S2SP2A07QC]MCA6542607.1 hypothetical prot
MNCFKSANIKIAIATTLLTQIVSIAIPTTVPSVIPSAIALPGQTPDQVIDWIRTNPALRPEAGERLLVRKSDTPSRRFQFQASVVLPGIAAIQKSEANLIRSEQIRIFDIINGVTRSRLEESLRSIYGPDIMRDYATAKRVYAYPTVAMLQRSQSKNASPILRALQGELRQGKKYAYWVELLQNGKGSANSGQITVFELDSLPKLEQELSNH